MAVLDFYLDVLQGGRRDCFIFLLTVNQYVWERKEHWTPVLPSEITWEPHPKFSSNIGDVVLYFIDRFSKDMQFDHQVWGVRTKFQELVNELCGNIPAFIDALPGLAKEQIVEENFRVREENVLAFKSPALTAVRNFMNVYEMHLTCQKDAEGFIKFLACVCGLTSRASVCENNEWMYLVLADAERSIHKLWGISPCYDELDRYSKLFLDVGKTIDNCSTSQYGSETIALVDEMQVETANPRCYCGEKFA